MAVSGQTAAAGSTYGAFDDNPDDLPRTFRREKEARAREQRERDAKERAAAPELPLGTQARSKPQPQMYATADVQPDIDELPFPATVRRIDLPFVHLVQFFLKAVVAAIPALILLGIVLWIMGAALHLLAPSLFKMKILIGFGN